jgi:hypothetical protein
MESEMNERIEELAEQAFDKANNGTISDIKIPKEFIEKFAELIVRECLAHGKLTQSQAVVNGSEEYNAGREMGIEVFMNQIKQHFGVEE